MSITVTWPEAVLTELETDVLSTAPDAVVADLTAVDSGELIDAVTGLSAGGAAQGLASILHAFPQQAIEDLERLISNDLGAPTPAELREARLGLLIEVVSSGDGEIPRTRDYDEVRKHRAQAKSEEWPAASTLVESYGSFLAAVKAAMRLHHEGSAARVPHTHRHARSYKRYSRDEVIAALRSFRDQHGSWPRSRLEYLTWAATVRRIKRNGGHPDPRLPSAKPVRALFGGFQRALAVAEAGNP